MWIITLNDMMNEEDIEVIAGDFDELQLILDYVRNSMGRFELECVEQRPMLFGFDGLRDMAGNDIPDKI